MKTDRDTHDRSERKPGPRSWFGRHLPLETETARFLLASVLDVLVTYLLIRQPHFREANPLALYFLNHWGVKGLVWFKFGSVAFVCLMCQVIAGKKLELARWLLNFATLVVGVVVVYSLALYVRHR